MKTSYKKFLNKNLKKCPICGCRYKINERKQLNPNFCSTFCEEENDRRNYES